MLARASLVFTVTALALSTVACSSLTRPDEIQIYGEQPVRPAKPAGAAPSPAPSPAGARPPAPVH